MNVEVAATIGARLRGLLGREAFDGVLMLVPCNDIHTFGMRRAIDVAFVAANGSVIETCRGLVPNRRLRNREARATLERFASPEPWFQTGDFIQRGL